MGQPTADHYIGRQYLGTEGSDIGETDQFPWSISLEGDVLIHNANPDWEEPDIPAGEDEDVRLTKVVIENTVTRLYFGTESNPTRSEVWLDPANYAISDPVYGDEPVFVQRFDPETPPEPEGRAAEGPETQLVPGAPLPGEEEPAEEPVEPETTEE